jgi:CubicO group peptidase (beta-lactamase class C family)
VRRASLLCAALCLAAALLLAGCGDDTPSAPAESMPQAKETARTSPDLDRAVAELQKAVPGIMQDWSVPGMAVAVVSGNRTVFAKGFGVKKAGSQDPVDTGTLFQIGSCSKAFTAALAASFADQGAFAFTDRVVDHLPKFQMHDPWVTGNFQIVDLMAQRSGMPAYALDGMAPLGYSADQMLSALPQVAPVTSFRSAYAYQNILFMAVGRMIERYGDATYESLLQKRILEPLGMHATNTRVQAMAQSDDAATGHARLDNATVPLDWSAPYQQAIDTLCPAGGINANVQDMATWVAFNLNEGVGPNGRLISNRSMEFIHTPKTVITRDGQGRMLYYCQGWVHQEDDPSPVLWHTGGTFGMGALVAFSPEQDAGLVMLSNLPGAHTLVVLETFFGALYGRDVSDVSARTLKLVHRQMAQDAPPAPPEDPAPPLDLSAYAGSYRNPAFKRLEVVKQDGRLAMALGPRNQTFPMTHFDRDTFSVSQPWPDNDPGLVRFAIGPEGRAQSATLEFLAEPEGATFARIPTNLQ